ncbi:MAG: glycosyltransferase [Planctomycetes bacterium]|nr:glycosyltransferase [Planctomycetota bacterium]
MPTDRAPLVVHYLDSLAPGGTERTLVALLEALDPARARHIVVTARGAGPLASNLPDHVACRALERTGACRTAGVTLGRLLRRWRATVVHTRNVGCWADTVLAGILAPATQVVLGFHGRETTRPFGSRERVITAFARRGDTRFTSVSHTGKALVTAQLRVPPEHITVLPNGVDTTRFRPAAAESRGRARARWRFGTRDVVVGIVGSLTGIKRHDLLLEAMERTAMDELRLLVVGDGPLRGELTVAAEQRGLHRRVTFAGSTGDVRPLLAAMDVYVCCSDHEGISNALLEAMAAGLPVISTDVGDHARILADGAGILIEAGEAGALGTALETLARNPDGRRTLGRAARRRAKQFSFAQVVRDYDAFYASLTGESARGMVLGSGRGNVSDLFPAERSLTERREQTSCHVAARATEPRP